MIARIPHHVTVFEYREDRGVLRMLKSLILVRGITHVVLATAALIPRAGGPERLSSLLIPFSDVVLLLSFAVFARWFYQANTNIRALGASDLEFSRTWGIGWFLVPLFNLWKPYFILRELWTASNPDSSGTTWRWDPVHPAVKLWWPATLLGMISYSVNGNPRSWLLCDLAAIASSILTWFVLDRIDSFQRERARKHPSRVGVDSRARLGELPPIRTEVTVYGTQTSGPLFATLLTIGMVIVAILWASHRNVYHLLTLSDGIQTVVADWFDCQEDRDYACLASMLPSGNGHGKTLESCRTYVSMTDSLFGPMTGYALTGVEKIRSSGAPTQVILTYAVACRRGQYVLLLVFKERQWGDPGLYDFQCIMSSAETDAIQAYR